MRFRLLALATATALVPACLLNWDSLRALDGGSDDASGDDLVALDVDTPDVVDAGNDTGPCTLDLLINEVSADGFQGSADEFVEIRNGASCGGSLLNWGLRYSSASGSSPSQLWTGQAGDVIGAKGHIILGGFEFQTPDSGILIGRISSDTSGSLSKNGGGVGLFSPGGTLIDGVAYGAITTPSHPFIRPPTALDGGASTPAPNPGTGKSIARIPDGLNTNINATDFQIATPSPGFTN